MSWEARRSSGQGLRRVVKKRRGLNVHYLATATSGEGKVLLTLFIMLVSAKLMAELFERTSASRRRRNLSGNSHWRRPWAVAH